MKKLLLFIFFFLFQMSFSQVITFECNNEIITVSFDEIANNPNADMDWDGDGLINESDYIIYLQQVYDCDNQWGGCEDYVTIVADCFCSDDETVVFWEEVNELNCTIWEMCECVPVNGGNWNDINWEDSDWADFDWDTIWSDLQGQFDFNLWNEVNWDNIPWGDIIDLDILPEDFITYIQNIIAEWLLNRLPWVN